MSQLADGLSPITARLRSRQALAYPISQVSLLLNRNDKAFENALSEILNWMRSRAGRALPKAAWDGEAFDLEEIDAQHTEAVTIDTPHYWAGRLDDADRAIAKRSWITEVGLAERLEDRRVVLGSRLTAVVRGEAVPFDRSVPGFVGQIVTLIGAELDGRQVGEAPWLIDSEDAVADLISLIRDPNRRVDVIVASLATGVHDASKTAVDMTDLARRTIGAAHVAVISALASFHLSDAIGKEFSVFHRGVRTYRPGFNPDLDEPFSHPLGLPNHIANWNGIGPSAYQNLLVSQALIRSVSASDSDAIVPSFLTVKRAAAEIRLQKARDAGSSDSELLALSESDNEDLKRQLEQEKGEKDALLIIAEEERNAAIETAEQSQATVNHLRRRLENLGSEEIGGAGQHRAVPANLDGFADWCENNLSGSVELHSRAHRGIKASRFEDVELIYQALLLLRDHYAPMCLGKGGADAFNEQLTSLHLSDEPSGSEERAGEQGDEYFVRYAGRRVFLSRHLKKGVSRDPRRSFRLYYFWDDETAQVVVGWLPSHLDTRNT